jgi:sarcosine oxidase
VLGGGGWAGGGGGRPPRGAYDGARLILTAGPWTGSLIPRTASRLSPERQVMLWTRAVRPELFQVGVFPVFYINVGEGPFYGFPIHGGHGFKIGKYHHRHEAVDPDTMDRVCSPEDEEVLRDGIRRYFPDADGPTLAMKTCLFTNTADEHFVIDMLDAGSRVCIAAGFSGHGFKFAPAIGELVAGLVNGTSDAPELFALGRRRQPVAAGRAR